MRLRLALIVVLMISTILRFYNLDWSRSIVWHPDERNMAAAIEQMYLPSSVRNLPSCFSQFDDSRWRSCNLNPHFFAYGGLPLYLSFIGATAFKSVTHLELVREINSHEATISLRALSALASTLSVLAVYLIGKIYLSRQLSLFAALLTAFIPGLIQSAHFGTTESVLGLLLLLISYSCVKFYLTGKLKYILYCAILTGLSLATKVSVIPFTAGPIAALVIMLVTEVKQNFKIGVLNFIKRIILFAPITLLIAFVGAPFNFLAFEEFRKIFGYDVPVALGKLPVFYTEQFVNTTPVVFQLQKVLPFALGLALSVTGITAIFICLTHAMVKKRTEILLIFFGFLPFLILNFFYFTKWTRYISPTFPFFALSFVLLLSLFNSKIIRNFIAVVVLLFSVAQGLAMFNIYAKEDIRFVSSRWIYQNIPSGSIVLSETANVSDIPISDENKVPDNYNIKNVIFNFYDVDVNKELQSDLIKNLTEADYVIIPSRRIFKNYPRLKNKYPIVNNYYENLFNGHLGFIKIAEFNSFPSLKIGDWEMALPDEDAEETFTVFDHPVVRIYEKDKQLSPDEYKTLLGIN